MNADVFLKLSALEAEKQAFVGTALKWGGKKLFGGANRAATGLASGVGRAGWGAAKAIGRHPMRAANVGFSGAILGEGLIAPPRVATRVPNAFSGIRQAT